MEYLLKSLTCIFKSRVNIPRIRHVEKQEIETLINEEVYLFAKYLGKERKPWKPRIVRLQDSCAGESGM